MWYMAMVRRIGSKNKVRTYEKLECGILIPRREQQVLKRFRHGLAELKFRTPRTLFNQSLAQWH
jgi:hypothetical protein